MAQTHLKFSFHYNTLKSWLFRCIAWELVSWIYFNPFRHFRSYITQDLVHEWWTPFFRLSKTYFNLVANTRLRKSLQSTFCRWSIIPEMNILNVTYS